MRFAVPLLLPPLCIGAADEGGGLSPEDLEAFSADHFVFSKIPIVPPPPELC